MVTGPAYMHSSILKWRDDLNNKLMCCSLAEDTANSILDVAACAVQQLNMHMQKKSILLAMHLSCVRYIP